MPIWSQLLFSRIKKEYQVAYLHVDNIHLFYEEKYEEHEKLEKFYMIKCETVFHLISNLEVFFESPHCDHFTAGRTKAANGKYLSYDDSKYTAVFKCSDILCVI